MTENDTHLTGPGALSLGKALLTSTNRPSIVWSFAMTTSAAKSQQNKREKVNKLEKVLDY